MGLNLCDRCAADCRHERNPNEIVVKCGAYKPPMTNADRIRAMSDEELAEFIEKCEAAGYEDSSIAWDKNNELMNMLDWLKYPAEEILHG